MMILGIETSSEIASIALCDDDDLVAARAFPSRLSLCQRLAAEIASLLDQLGLERSLEAIAVSRGPGSFTSLRIGVITAKAMAHRLGLPLAGVSATEAVAWPLAGLAEGAICSLLPAWKTAVYVAAYAPEPEGGLREIIAPTAMQPEALTEALAGIDGPLLMAGAAAGEHRQLLARALGARAVFAPAALGMPEARHVAAVARLWLTQPDPDAAFNLRPLYVVPSQAERVAGVDLGLTGVND